MTKNIKYLIILLHLKNKYAALKKSLILSKPLNNTDKNLHKALKINKRIINLFSAPILATKIVETKLNSSNLSEKDIKFTYKHKTLSQILKDNLNKLKLTNLNAAKRQDLILAEELLGNDSKIQNQNQKNKKIISESFFNPESKYFTPYTGQKKNNKYNLAHKYFLLLAQNWKKDLKKSTIKDTASMKYLKKEIAKIEVVYNHIWNTQNNKLQIKKVKNLINLLFPNYNYDNISDLINKNKNLYQPKLFFDLIPFIKSPVPVKKNRAIFRRALLENKEKIYSFLIRAKILRNKALKYVGLVSLEEKNQLKDSKIILKKNKRIAKKTRLEMRQILKKINRISKFISESKLEIESSIPTQSFNKDILNTHINIEKGNDTLNNSSIQNFTDTLNSRRSPERLNFINKSNFIKMKQTFKNILKQKKFDPEFNYISPNPVDIQYYTNSLPTANWNPADNSSSMTSSKAQLKTSRFSYSNSFEVNEAINKYKFNTLDYHLPLPAVSANNQIPLPVPAINQYIKSMSKFNMNRKGIFMNYSNIIGFNFNYETNKLMKNTYKFLAAFFKTMYCLISKPVFIITPDKVTIQLFYFLCTPKPGVFKWFNYFKNKAELTGENNSSLINKKNNLHSKLYVPRFIKKSLRNLKNKNIIIRNRLFKLNKSNLTKTFSDRFNLLCTILSKIFNKPVELQLIRLHHPYHDSNILVNLLGLIVKRRNVKSAIKHVYEKKVVKDLNTVNMLKKSKANNLISPAFVSGLKIKIGGRLMREPIVPRLTVNKFDRGAVAPGKVNFLDVARITKKNRKGAYSITISTGQNFF